MYTWLHLPHTICITLLTSYSPHVNLVCCVLYCVVLWNVNIVNMSLIIRGSPWIQRSPLWPPVQKTPIQRRFIPNNHKLIQGQQRTQLTRILPPRGEELPYLQMQTICALTWTLVLKLNVFFSKVQFSQCGQMLLNPAVYPWGASSLWMLHQTSRMRTETLHAGLGFLQNNANYEMKDRR